MDWQLVASYFTVKSTDIFYSVRENKYLAWVYGVDRKKMSRGPLIGITRLAERCRTVIPSEGFFYRPHHTPMIDTFSCTTFDFQRRACYKVTLFPLKSFYSSLKRSTLPATAVQFFTFTSNLHKETSFFDVATVKTNVT